MKQADINRDIATEAAVEIVNTLVMDYKIPAEKLFDFLKSHEGYKDLLDDDGVLACLLHDDSIYEMIEVLKEQING